MNTLDVNPVSPRPTGIRYGLIASLASIALGLIGSTAGLIDYTNQNSSGNWIISLVGYAIIIGALVLAMQKHRSDLGGYMTFGQGFMVGLWVTIITAVISLIWTYVNFAFIEKDALDTIMESSRDQMINQGMSQEQVDQAMQYSGWMMNPTMMAVFAGVGGVFGGLILSLIIAAIMQRKPKENTAM